MKKKSRQLLPDSFNFWLLKSINITIIIFQSPYLPLYDIDV